MNEAPKKIWVDGERHVFSSDDYMDTVPYIRADIVDELVETVEEVLRISDRKHDAWDRARATLAKLEDV